MTNTASNNEISHNGRTHSQHCAWLESLVGDEYRVFHMPIGYLFSLAEISFLIQAAEVRDECAGAPQGSRYHCNLCLWSGHSRGRSRN
jgi:hypothetical protein